MDVNHYSFTDLQEIMRRLRAPDGCPWDRKQTHESLKSCMIEEAAELVAAIDVWEECGDDANLIEELGDVLLQVAMHVAIAEEEGRFTMEDVTTEISRKMIRRHPHVFADVTAETPQEVLANWEEIKKSEKSHASKEDNPVTQRRILEEVAALLNQMAARKGMQEEIVLLYKD